MIARCATGFSRARALLPAGCAALLLAGCASHEPAPVVDLSPAPAPVAAGNAPAAVPGNYRVVRGDTLYAIAFRHGLDFRDVAAWNHIEPPYRIYAGQELTLQGEHEPRPAAPAPSRAPAPAPVQSAAAADRVAPKAAAATPAKSGGPGMFEDVPATSAAVPASPESRSPPAREATAAAPPSPMTAPPAANAAEAKPAVPPKPQAAASAATPAIAPDSASSAGGITWRWPGKGALLGTFVAGDQTRQGIDIGGNSGDPVLAAADGEVVYSGNGLIGYGELVIIKHNASFLSAYGHNRKRLVQEGDRIRAGQQIAEMGSSASSRDELHFEIRKNGKPVNPLDYLPAR